MPLISYEMPDAWWAWFSLHGFQSVRPLGCILQQPPEVHEQNVLIFGRLEFVQKCLLQHIFHVCATHIEMIHLCVETYKLAHVVVNHAKLGLQ